MKCGLWGCVVLAACASTKTTVAPRAPDAADAIYFVMVDRFENGDPTNDGNIAPDDPQGWHGGDLQGILQRLDTISEMGFKTLWLSPIHNGRDAKFHEWGAYHGYWVHDLASVHPRFGTHDDVRELSQALEERGMRLMLDVVFNHTGFDAPRRKSHPHWFHDTPSIENWADPVESVTHQVHGLPDLAQEHPEVYAYLRDTTQQWIAEYGVDALRIDAVRHMPQTELRKLQRDWKQHFNQPIFTVAEIFEGNAYALNQLWTAGEYTTAFNFPLHHALVDTFCHQKSANRLASTMDTTSQVTQAAWVNFLDNHDVMRLASACDGDVARIKNALTALIVSPGTPMMTYGTESLLAGQGEPENRRDMNHNHRPLAEHITTRLQVRAKHPALRSLVRQTKLVSDDHWLDLRWADDETAAVLVNTSDSPWTVTLPWTDGSLPLGGAQWNDGKLVVAANTTTVAMGPALPAPNNDVVVMQWQRPDGFRNHSPRLVGNHPELGLWDPMKAPTWSDAPIALRVPRGTTIAYKLAWISQTGEVTWESGDNRYHHATDAHTLSIIPRPHREENTPWPN